MLLKLKLLRGYKQTKKFVGYIFCLRFFCDPLKLACVRQPSLTKPSFPTVHTTEAFGIYKVLDNRNSHHANGMVRAPLDAFTFKKWKHCSSEAGSSTFKKLRAESAQRTDSEASSEVPSLVVTTPCELRCRDDWRGDPLSKRKCCYLWSSFSFCNVTTNLNEPCLWCEQVELTVRKW